MLSKSIPIVIAYLAQPWGTAYKRILLSSCLLDKPSCTRLNLKIGRKCFSSCNFSANCRSLRPLGLRIIHLMDRFYLFGLFLGKKCLVIMLLIPSRLFSFVPPWVTMSILYLCSDSPLRNLHRKAIFLTVYVVYVPTTAL